MKKDTKEKICAFYASDYHFEMVSLPYINNKIENNNEIIVLTENNLEQTIKILLEKTNLKVDKKEKILNIDWKNNDFEKFKSIKTKIDEQKDLIIFIKGKENYINNVNQNIQKWITKNDNIKIIDCYDIEEVGEKTDEIMKKYKKILRTSGEREINKIYKNS